jgi:ABC-type lipoprotein export system ATPase subunit
MYTLAGLERPESGSVEFEGRNLYNGSSSAQARFRNQKMGFVFQGYFLLPELTALENVFLPGMIGRRATTKTAQESLDAVGLGDRMHHLPAELSGGEQQRVAIARAIVAEPSAILADEPTAALDAANGRTTMGILSAIAKERGRAVLVVTHDPRLFGFADRIVHIEDGSLTREELTDSRSI